MKKKGDLADPLESDFETPGGETVEEKAEILIQMGQYGHPEEEFPRIETHTETQSLKCILTDEELRKSGERMARADGEKRDHEATLKSVASRYKSMIDESVAVMSSEGEKIRSGYEFRTVEIDVRFDHATGFVTKMRKDCGEVIEHRIMTTYEAQRKIKF